MTACQVSAILQTFSPNFQEQIKLRKFFYKGSTMLRRGRPSKPARDSVSDL